ncbi:MAG TPA: hypothetical protein DD727_09285 [Clostridiales bacterium]|nr:hypothetical protein [Clostridiales bacterium]
MQYFYLFMEDLYMEDLYRIRICTGFGFVPASCKPQSGYGRVESLSGNGLGSPGRRWRRWKCYV